MQLPGVTLSRTSRTGLHLGLPRDLTQLTVVELLVVPALAEGADPELLYGDMNGAYVNGAYVNGAYVNGDASDLSWSLQAEHTVYVLVFVRGLAKVAVPGH